MRKLLFFFAVILGFCMVIPEVFAAETLTVEICTDTEKAISGDEIVCNIVVSGNAPCRSFGVVLEYDSSVFEIVSGECALENSLLGVFDKEKGFAYLFDEAVIPEGLIGTFVLRVKKGIPTDEAVISGRASAKNAEVTVDITVVGDSVLLYGTGQNNYIVQPPATSEPAQEEQIPVQTGSDTADIEDYASESRAPTEAVETEPATEGNEEATVGITDTQTQEQNLEGGRRQPDNRVVYLVMGLVVAAGVGVVALLAILRKKT